MPLKERVFNCKVCGEVKDRDFNASLNARTSWPLAIRFEPVDRVLPTVRDEAAQSPISAVSVEKELCKTGTKL